MTRTVTLGDALDMTAAGPAEGSYSLLWEAKASGLGKPLGVGSVREQLPAVADEQPIPVRGTEVSPRHNSGIRRTYCGAAGGAEVGAVVQFPDPQHWMQPHAERRGHCARDWSEKPVASWPSDRGIAQPSRPR